MFIIVKCKCGEIVEFDMEGKTVCFIEHHRERIIGMKDCPNPECSETICASASIYFDVILNEKNPKLGWEELAVGQMIRFESHLFEVAFKRVYKAISQRGLDITHNLLYMRSLEDRGNIILEVSVGGILSIYSITGKKYNTENPEMWTENEIKELI